MMSTIRRTLQSLCAPASVLLVCLAFNLAGPFAQPASGGVFTLSDNNSVASFNTGSQAGVNNWTVDGVNQLNQQWFWFRVGNAPESSLDTLPISAEGATDTNFNGFNDTLFTQRTDGTVRITTRYSLDGGTVGSGTSDMGEQISITNLTAGNLDFHFYQYTDFDLQGTPGGDTAFFTNNNTVRQADGATRLTETVVTPVPNHREIDFYPNTLGRLNDGLPTTLNDTPLGLVVGPGDVTWAFEWDISLAPGATFQISKDKNIGLVPEPASWVLLVLGAMMLTAHRRFRRK